ncbi:MAG: AlbA family DNA-binding domain-containing protein [bacterium]
MDKKEELFSIYNTRKLYYKKIFFKGAFFRCEDNNFIPIKLFFVPINDDNNYKDNLMIYNNLLLIEYFIDLKQFETFLKTAEEDFIFEKKSYLLKISKNYFDYFTKQENNLYQDNERIMVNESRSFPKSNLRQWSTKVYILYNNFNDGCNSNYNNESRLPLPIIKDQPIMPTIQEAISWWFDKDKNEELSQISDNRIILFFPDYKARIKNVKLTKSNIIINVEINSNITLNDLKGKYFLKYNDKSYDFGDIEFKATEHAIDITQNIERFYLAIYDIKNPLSRLDYRDFNWSYVWYPQFGNRQLLDIEIENTDENFIEYLISTGENKHIEYKLKIDKEDSKEFLESVCSFLNTKGGNILIGVDDHANVKGIEEKEITGYKQRIHDLIDFYIEPQDFNDTITVQDIKYGDKKIINIAIQEGKNKPYNYKGQGFYIRTDGTDRLANRIEIDNIYPKPNVNNILNNEYSYP